MLFDFAETLRVKIPATRNMIAAASSGRKLNTTRIASEPVEGFRYGVIEKNATRVYITRIPMNTRATPTALINCDVLLAFMILAYTRLATFEWIITYQHRLILRDPGYGTARSEDSSSCSADQDDPR
jgi:hypothetical protein